MNGGLVFKLLNVIGVLLLFLVVGVVGFGEGTQADVRSGEQMVLVLDASKAMQGSFGSETKFEAAQSAIVNLVKDWDASVALGVTVTGSRKSNDCKDIHRVLPVGNVRRQRFEQVIRGLRVRGAAPIAEAVVKAARDQYFAEEKASVIVIAAGHDSCHADPCMVAKDLELKGKELTVHVLELVRAPGAASRKLRCFATSTGGRFRQHRLLKN